MGEVYRVRDISQDTIVAIKLLTKGWKDQGVVQRFKGEFSLLSRLHHPHIVRVYDFGLLENGTPYFTMEFVAGENIKKRASSIDLLLLHPLVVQICHALHFLHSRGIVHRDLKPSNILVTSEGTVKLTDFGLAVTQSNQGESSFPAGTIPYLSPEAIRGLPLDQRADLYSLGIILYELVAGHPPFQGDNLTVMRNHVESPPPPLPALVPKAWQKTIGKLLEKAPSRRYSSALEIVEELRTVAGNGEIPALIEPVDIQATEFVGRERELSQLGDLAESSEGFLVLISGEEGVGKSWLMTEFKFQLQLKGFSPIEVRGVTPLLDLLQRLRTGGRRQFSPPEPGSALTHLGEEMVESLKAARKGGFISILIEDLHMADDMNLDLLVYLGRSLDDLHILICCSCDSNNSNRFNRIRTGMEGVSRLRVISLNPLTQDGSATLVNSLLGNMGIPEDLVDLIHRKTGGNPLWIVQLIRTWMQEGVILWRDGRWAVSGGSSVAEIPDDVRKMVLRRLSGLGEENLHILQLAAVIGDEFTLQTVETIGEGEATSALLEAERTGIIVYDSEDERYRFTHGIFQEMLYEMAPQPIRERSHRKIARELEQIYEEGGEEVVEQLARHLYRGGVVEKARRFSLLAGEAACRRYAHQEAAIHFEHALTLAQERIEQAEILSRLGEIYFMMGHFQKSIPRYERAISISSETSMPLEERARLHRRLGKVHERMGDDHQLALSWYQRGIDLLGDDQGREKTRLSLEVAWILCNDGEYEKAAEMSSSAYKAARILGDDVAIFRAHSTLGNIHLKKGQLDKSLYHYVQAQTVAERLGSDVEIAMAYHNVGIIHGQMGNWEMCARFLQRSLKEREEIGDARGIAELCNSLGACYIILGRWQEGKTILERGLELARRLGNSPIIRSCLDNLATGYHLHDRDLKRAVEFYNRVLDQNPVPNNRGWTLKRLGSIYDDMGRWSDALRHYREALKLFTRHRNRLGIANVHCNLGLLFQKMGETKKARALFDKGLRVAREVGNISLIIDFLSNQGSLFLQEGDPQPAEACFHEARSLAEERELKRERAELYMKLGELFLHRGETEVSLDFCHRALDMAAECRSNQISATLHRLMALAYWALDLWDKAEEGFQRSVEEFKQIDLPYELGRTYYEYGRFSMAYGFSEQAQSYLEEARQIFETTGAKTEVKKTTEALRAFVGSEVLTD